VIRKVGVILLGVAVCLLGTTSALAMKYNESPMLKTKVAAGLLPPVEERLPEEPKVLSAERNEVRKGNIDFEIGQYGGTLRMCRADPNWHADLFVMLQEPLVNAPGILGENVRGNVLESFEVSKDEKVFTFHMRKGLKWSDGVPVTTKDVLFAYEDVLLNKELTPVFPQWLRSANKPDGEPMKLKVIDDYTFQISFSEPYGGFPAQLAIIGWKGYTDLLKPKHYLKSFHIRYTPLEKLEPLIKEESLAEGEWWTLFNKKDFACWEFTSPECIGFPLLTPWIPVKATPVRVVYERNPYYFKVDSEGNQLPYIDRIYSDIVSDQEMKAMKDIAGEIDFDPQPALTDLSLFKENEEAGGYRVLLLDMHVDPVNVHFNQTYPDPVWRKVVRDTRFRKALSLAIDREEIIDAVYFGFAEPSELVPSEYDPETANRLLDGMGLDKRDAEGYRLGPDGKTFVIPFEVAEHDRDIVPVTELVSEHWKKVGIKATIKKIDPGLWATRLAANEVKATVMWNHAPLWWGWGGFGAGDIDRYDWPLWRSWYDTNGEKGEEPPEDVKKFLNLRTASIVVSPEKAKKVVNEYFRLMYDKVFFIQLVTKVKYPTIASRKLGNVPHKGFAIETSFGAEQFFFRK